MTESVEYLIKARDMLSGVIGAASQSAETLTDNVEKSKKSFENLNKTVPGKIQKLTKTLDGLKDRQQRAFDDKHIAKYNLLINKTQNELNRLNNLPPKSFIDRMRSAEKSSFSLAKGIGVLGAAIGAMALIRSSEQAFKTQATAETKLQAVMKNTMNATRDQVDSILELADAQEKLGVVSKATQTGGAQELGTYLSKASSLKKLMPVMNDMLAQQYGYNATQEQAVQVASMIGKVMDGQVGALSRYGYAFTEAQERVLKFGDEEERAAVLTEVISASVGGMNEALAATPEGKLQKVANEMSSLQERLGEIIINLKLALVPIMEAGLAFVDKFLMPVFTWIGKNAEILTQLGLVILGGVVAYKAIAGAVALWTAATKIMTIAQMALNIALNANPIGLIIIAITAIIAMIVLAVKKFKQFGAVMLAMMGPIGWIVLLIKSLKTHWDSIVSAFKEGGILGGLKRIGIVLLDTILYPVQQLLEMLAKIPGLGKLAAKGAQSIDKMRERLNLKTESGDKKEESKESQTVGGSIRPDDASSYDPGQAIGDIAGGGAKATNITVNLNREMVGQITINPVTMTQGASEIRDLLMETLSQVLNSANRVALD